ncbi:MAG: 4Fe-4S binding protein [bacterium]|nr:4Fe-4S binding protein [bacterium]
MKDTSYTDTETAGGKAAPSLLSPFMTGLIKSEWFLPSLQTITVVLLAYGIYDGFAGSDNARESWNHWLFWEAWWQGGLVLILFTLGKSWCGVCPVRAVNRMAERFSLGIPLPSPMKNIAFNIFMYLVMIRLLLYMPGIALPRMPVNSSIYFLAFTLLAVVIGVLFKRGAFCRYVCPISSATDLYAMTAPVAIRSDLDKCAACTTKDCIKGNKKAPGCRYDVFPGAIESDRHCTFCLDCFKSCPHNSMTIAKRPFFSGVWRERKPVTGEAILAVIFFAVIFFRMGVMHHPSWAKVTIALGTAPKTYSFFLAKYLITFVSAVSLVVILYWLCSRISEKLTGSEKNRHLSVFGYGYLPYIVFVGLLQYGWLDYGRARLIAPLIIGTSLSAYSMKRLAASHLEEADRRTALMSHIFLLVTLSAIILIFQNLWPMRF